MRAFIVAEAGVNHNGSLDLAKRLIEAAAEAGADAVKFQSFRSSSLVSRVARKAEYQIQNTRDGGSQLDMIRSLELSREDHRALIDEAERRGIEFLSTPFDPESLALLTGELGLSRIKVSSGDLTNAPLLVDIARCAHSVVLSTGMATLGEVESALGALAFGFLGSGLEPGVETFARCFASKEGQRALRERVTLLHCTTEYPAPVAEVNLRAMATMAAAFGLPVGYSDHTSGYHVSLAAAALGAVFLEKHFTLDRNLPGPDHRASLEPAELTDMIRQIREIEAALGDGVKAPSPSEIKNRTVARRSLVTARDIAEGEIFTMENLVVKRPGHGIPPTEYWNYLGRPAARPYHSDEVIDG